MQAFYPKRNCAILVYNNIIESVVLGPVVHAGFALNHGLKIHLGPVVQKPINANLGLNLLNLGLNFNPRLLCVVQR
jgi:hypothetical protein